MAHIAMKLSGTGMDKLNLLNEVYVCNTCGKQTHPVTADMPGEYKYYCPTCDENYTYNHPALVRVNPGICDESSIDDLNEAGKKGRKQ